MIDLYRCGFPIDAPSGGERRNCVVSVVDRTTPYPAHSVSTRRPTWGTARRCFTRTPITRASINRCRLLSPKLIDIQSKETYTVAVYDTIAMSPLANPRFGAEGLWPLQTSGKIFCSAKKQILGQIGKLLGLCKAKSVQLYGASSPDPLNRGCAPGPRWGLCLQTPVMASCFRYRQAYSTINEGQR